MEKRTASRIMLTLLLSMSMLAINRVTAQSVITIGIGVYWDSSSANLVSSINWGVLQPGSVEDVVVYIRNEGNVPVTLSLASSNWNPLAASSYMTLIWNYTGGVLEPSGVVPVKLSLLVTSSIVGIYAFSFDCVLTASGSSTASVLIATYGSITRTWIVDDDGPADFHTIQEAIYAANPGDTIFVHNGIYEPIRVFQILTIIGEDRSHTIIDGAGAADTDVVSVGRNNVTIKEFTIRNGAFSGIRFSFVTNVTVQNNNITANRIAGITLSHSFNNTISGNDITNNGHGIDFFYDSSNNSILGNEIANNIWGIGLYYSSDNLVYHNNFADNTNQIDRWESINIWDDCYPSGGNYWSDYSTRYPDALELDNSGIWDTPYVIDGNNQDNYPLMEPWTPTPPTITASVDIDPDTLNMKSKGKWITVYIQLPEDYNPADIDASTILLNGTVAPVLDSKYGFVTDASEYLVDYNSDGILERMVKFDRASLASWIYQSVGMQHEISLTITGELTEGTPFEGTGTIFAFWQGHRSPTKQ